MDRQNKAIAPFFNYLAQDKLRREAEKYAIIEFIKKGQLPTPDDILEKLTGNLIAGAGDILRHHPGAQIALKIEWAKVALQTFKTALLDLTECLANFHWESAEQSYFSPNNIGFADKQSQKINKELFAVCCAVAALRDHARRLNKTIIHPDYESQASLLAKPDQAFIIGLRNNLNHSMWSRPGWNIKYGKGERKTFWSLSRTSLLEHGDWKSEAKKYLLEAKEKIDIGEMLKIYEKRIDDFYGWYFPVCEMIKPEEAKDYERCMNAVRTQNKKNEIKLWLGVALQLKDLDPYKHLDKFFNERQLQEILALPKHSRQQVDLMISLYDNYGVCDLELRNNAYQLFKAQ